MNKLIIFLLVLLLLAIPVSAQSMVTAGTIVYIDGMVDIYRDGKLIDRQMVDIGSTVEAYDIIETGPDGIAEIAMTGAYGGSSTVIVKASTVFAVELNETAGTKETSLQLMRGSIGVRVGRLAGRESITLKTESAVMGVRGTSFDVLASPEGGILVTCDSGSVSCRDNQGNEVFARPGAVVENVPEKRIAAVSVAVEDLMLYQQFWMNTRQQVFRSGAEMFIRSYARQYRAAYPRLQQAYTELSGQRSTLERYGRVDADIPLGDLMKARSDASPAVVSMRGILPMFEMVYFRLQELKSYHDEGHGRGMVETGLTTDSFFNDFSQQTRQMNQTLSDIRYLLKLYSIIHEESGGGPSILDDPFGGGSIFEGVPGGGLDFQGF